MKRPKVRISVRTMMALVLVLGVVLGWLSYRARVQRNAVAAITKATGYVKYDWELRKVFGFESGTHWWPSWLARAVGPDHFQTVVWVDLLRGFDRDLDSISRLPRVEHLNLATSSVTDAGLGRLAGLTRLS
jgi:hypothetical protein